MDDWPKDVFALLEAVTSEVEQFFQEVGETIDIIATQTQQMMAEDLNQFIDDLEDLFEPIAIVYSEFDEITDDFESPLDYKVEATLEENAACIGCHHYHGQVYGGNLLVCGMHPYGWEGESCPDWEGMGQ